MADIKDPIMICCTGRSGSTMFYRILAQHKDLGWLSTLNQAFPKQTWMAPLHNLYRLSIFDNIKDTKYFPKPFSTYNFWLQYLPGITRHHAPLLPEDVPAAAIVPLRKKVAHILCLQNRKRLLIKVTGWARMAYFDRVFPGLRFIYLKRDPKDVVASWVRAGWLNVTGALNSDDWEWGEVPHEYRQIYEDMGCAPILSGAIKTQLDIDDLRRNAAMFPDRCYELNYEDLIAEPRKHLQETLDFCDLKWDEGFERAFRAAKIRNYKSRWKQYVSKQDGELLVEFYDRVQDLQSAPALV
ncbi:sulfotransferase [bacterium]|nr:sulfotransferase [bacterium]